MFQEPRPRSEFRSTRSQTKSVRGARLVEGDGDRTTVLRNGPVLGAEKQLRVATRNCTRGADLGEVDALRMQAEPHRESGVSTDRTTEFAQEHESPHPRWCECGPLPQT